MAAAVAMQQRVEASNPYAEERLSIRVGVSHGEADVEDGDYLGHQLSRLPASVRTRSGRPGARDGASTTTCG